MDCEDDEDDENVEADDEARREVEKLVEPRLPSTEDVEKHEMTHLPFANWCRHCVGGRGEEAAHYRSSQEGFSANEFHFDWAFP